MRGLKHGYSSSESAHYIVIPLNQKSREPSVELLQPPVLVAPPEYITPTVRHSIDVWPRSINLGALIKLTICIYPQSIQEALR